MRRETTRGGRGWTTDFGLVSAMQVVTAVLSVAQFGSLQAAKRDSDNEGFPYSMAA
jgi:hypothetical protein